MFTLAIDNVVQFPVAFTLLSGNVHRRFSFTVTATRLESEEINKRLEDADKKFAEFLASVITGWSGQKLVIDAAGQPADFSPEALAAMQSAPGVSLALFNAYFKACAAQEKN